MTQFTTHGHVHVHVLMYTYLILMIMYVRVPVVVRPPFHFYRTYMKSPDAVLYHRMYFLRIHGLRVTPAASSLGLSSPLKASGTSPGASALGPSSHPPTYSPPIQMEGTDDFLVIRPS